MRTRSGNTARFTAWAALAMAGAMSAAVACGRDWTDRTGQRHFEAEFVDVADGRPLLKPIDGPTFRLRWEELSEPDERYIRAEIVRRREELKSWLSDQPGTILYGPGRTLCQLQSQAVNESSGIACSRRVPGVFWTHNDSGDAARLYAFDLKGRDLGSFLLEDVVAFDFEDIASCVLDGTSYLLVGDIGNNGRHASVQMIHVVEEPAVDLRRGVSVAKAPVAQTIYYAYDDDCHDCEALGVDPTSKTFVVISKEFERQCNAYAFAWPAKEVKKAVVARKIATLKLPTVTAMDISPDGRRAIVGTYGHAYEFTRRTGDDWAAAFARKPCEVPLPPRRQGEGVCYGPDGQTLYLTSEKLPTPLVEVPVRSSPAASDKRPE